MVSNRDIIGLLGEQKELENEQKFILNQATNNAAIVDLDEPPQHRRETSAYEIPQKVDLLSNLISQ